MHWQVGHALPGPSHDMQSSSRRRGAVCGPVSNRWSLVTTVTGRAVSSHGKFQYVFWFNSFPHIRAIQHAHICAIWHIYVVKLWTYMSFRRYLSHAIQICWFIYVSFRRYMLVYICWFSSIYVVRYVDICWEMHIYVAQNAHICATFEHISTRLRYISTTYIDENAHICAT